MIELGNDRKYTDDLVSVTSRVETSRSLRFNDFHKEMNTYSLTITEREPT